MEDSHIGNLDIGSSPRSCTNGDEKGDQELGDWKQDIKPNVADIHIIPSRNEPIPQTSECYNIHMSSSITRPSMKIDDGNKHVDIMQNMISSQVSSHLADNGIIKDDLSLISRSQSTLNLNDKISNEDIMNQEPVGIVSATESKTSLRQQSHVDNHVHVSDDLDVEKDTVEIPSNVRNVHLSDGTKMNKTIEAEDHVTESERSMKKVEKMEQTKIKKRKIPNNNSSIRLLNTNVFVKRLPSFIRNDASENDLYSTYKIGTMLSNDFNEHSITSVNSNGCNVTDYLEDSVSSYHNEKVDITDEDGHNKTGGIGSVKKEKFAMHEVLGAFNADQRGLYICWICLRKFMACLDVKGHILQNHSEALCAYVQLEDMDSKIQPKLLLFCPNQCSYVSSQLYVFSYHILFCQNPTFFTKGHDFREIQKTFISDKYFELRKKLASGDILKKLKIPESSPEPCNERNDEIMEPDDAPDGTNDELRKKLASGVVLNRLKITACNDKKDEILEPDDAQDGTNADLRKYPESSPKPCNNRNDEIWEPDDAPDGTNDEQTGVENHQEHFTEPVDQDGECTETTIRKSEFNHSEKKANDKLLLESPLKSCFVEKVDVSKSSGRGKKFTCNICSKDFVTERYLKRHMRRHDEISTCIYCGKKFSRRTSLLTHMRVQHGQKLCKSDECGESDSLVCDHSKHIEAEEDRKPFSCCESAESYTIEKDLQDHMTFHDSDKPFKCQLGVNGIYQISDFYSHIKTHREKHPFICSVCGEGLMSKSALITHSKIHTDENPFKCSTYDESYEHKHQPDVHIEEQHREAQHKEINSDLGLDTKPWVKTDKCDESCENSYLQKANSSKVPKIYNCNECDKSFNDSYRLQVHKTMHVIKESKKCIECGLNFISNHSYHAHMREHYGKKPFKCTDCDKCFKTISSLQAHSTVHSTSKPFDCLYCNKHFATKIGLNNHMVGHTDAFKCQECGMGCRTLRNLNEHIGVHSGDRPYKCTECDKSYLQKNSLRIHMRNHSGERPFQCTECPLSFAQGSTLNTHMRIHRGEMLYQCNECGIRTIHASSLRRHLQVHSGVKPFECDVCGKRFTHKNSLNKHKIIHTGEKPFVCQECGKCFNRATTLKTHMKTHRRIIQN